MSRLKASLVAIISLPLFLILSMVADVTCLKRAMALSDSLDDAVAVIDCANQLVVIKSAVLACQMAPRAFRGGHCGSSSSAIDVVKTACEYRRYCQLVASNVTFDTNCTGALSLNISYECVAGLNDTILPPVLLNVDESSVQLRLDANHQTIQRRYVPMSQPCAVPGFLFEGFGYVLLAPDQFIGEKLKFQQMNFFFRTTNPDGILFAGFRKDLSSYVYLALIKGELEFGVKGDGDDHQRIRTRNKTWDDNRFYRVEARTTQKKKLVLRVSYGSEELFEHTEPLKKKGEIVVDNSYVGGLPTNSSLLTLLPDSIGFIGCIRVVFLLRSTLEFDSSKIERLVNVVQENGGCPPSVEKAMHFRGSGYVKLNLSSSQMNDELQFRFRIRTSWPNGLLLAAFGDVSEDFLFVETRGCGGIIVRYRTNEERVNVFRVNRCILCDGSWHEVDLSITDRVIILRVDNAEDEDISPIINVTKFASEILQNVYFGGLPQYNLSETKPTPVEVALGFGVNVTGYGGCLANFSVNEILIDVVKKREGSANVSFAGCPNFPWNGPVCEDQLMAINSTSGNDSTVTDADVDAFTEYLYRAVANVPGGGAVFSEWMAVRSGDDSSSSGRFRPEIDYDGMSATIQWTGPPTVLNDSLYDIDIYTCAVCLNTTISSCYHVEDTTLPHQLKLSSEASLAMYTVQITASVLNEATALTSNFSTALVTKPKALSRVCKCSNGEGVFSFACNKTKSSDCISFNTSSCETMLEQSSGFCLSETAASSSSDICPPPTVSPTTTLATDSLSSIVTPSSSPVRSSAVPPTTGDPVDPCSFLPSAVAGVSATASSDCPNNTVAIIDCANKLVDIKSVMLACQTVPRSFHESHCKSPNSPIDVVRTACQYKSYCQLVASNITFETNCTGSLSLNISYECVAGLNDTIFPPVLLNVDKSYVRLRRDANHQTIQRRYVPMSQPCAVPGFLFEGFGYVLLAPDQFINKKFQFMRLFFRTTNPDGILFATFRKDLSSYIYLALIDGELEFGVKGDGDDHQSIKTHNKTWDDNRFYRVEARTTLKENLVLRVFYGSEELFGHVGPLKKKGETFTVVVDNSYVGGLPMNASLLTPLPDSIGFIGCIRVMFLQRSTVEFDSLKIERLVNVVQENGGCPPSVEKAMHFRGSGYVKLNLSSSQINDTLRFHFRIRTSWPNGLLLAAFGDVSKDFLFVETRGRGGIIVRYRTNEERVNVIRVNRCILCDGSWHEIDLSITDRLVIVRVDNAEDEDISPIINVREFSSEILQNVYFGGLPQYDLSETKPTPVEVAFGVGVNVTEYGGCLANFSVNEILIDVVKKREGSANVSFAGCPNFPWNGPVCEDQLMAINSTSGNDSAVTDADVDAFTEYLYRAVANVPGGGAVFSEWIAVRSGDDSSSSGRFRPEIDYDGMSATIQWTGPPTVLTDSLYDIDIYTCAVCLNTTISSCYHVEDTTLPRQLKLSSEESLAMYTVQITSSVLNEATTLTSNFSTALVTKPKALSRVCECSNGEGVFSFACNKTKSSDCISFNTSSCETMLEQSSGFCLSETAASSSSDICPSPTVSLTTTLVTDSLSSIATPSSSPVRLSAVPPTTGDPVDPCSFLPSAVAGVSATASSDCPNNTVAIIDCANKLVDIKSVMLACQTVPRSFHESHCKSPNSPIDVVRTACQYKSYCQLVASNVTFETNCTGSLSLNISYECVAGLNDTIFPPVLLNVDKSYVRLRRDANHQTIQRRYVPMSQPCAVPGFLFEGFGYVLLAPDQFINKKFQFMRLFFRTTNPDGILFATFRKDLSSYIYLALIDGELEFGVKGDGDDHQSIKTHNKTWDDNRFYRVEARTTLKENLVLRVFYGSEELFGHVGPLKKKGETFIVVVDNSYVGGLPMNASLLTPLPDSIGFIGCIRVMFLQRSTVEFDSLKIERLVNVVQENGGCPPSVEKAMHFRGSSYVKLNLSSSQMNDELQFRFRIRTSWPNGLLLAAFGDVSEDFLFVETRGRGGIIVRYRTNEERVNVFRVNRCILCDGSWHEVDLSIADGFFIVRIDDTDGEEFAHTINVRDFASEILQNVYVGGLPQYDLSETRPSPVEVALGFGVNVNGYGGCLANFFVNEILIDVVKKREESAYVSFAGCPHFPWNGPACEDQLIAINSTSGNESAFTDADVDAFTEYLYRVGTNLSGGGVVFSEWINVRTGNDSSSSGRFLPEIDDDGMKATIQWTGPPTVLRDEKSYDIDIYTCAVCLNTTILSCCHWRKEEDATLPYRFCPVAPSTMHTVNIAASVLDQDKRLTSNFSTPVVTQKPEAHSECSKDENECVFSFVANETEYSGCLCSNTSWCSTMLEWNSPSSIKTSSYGDICPSLTVFPTAETSSSAALDDAYIVVIGIGCFLVVIVVGLFLYWKKKRKLAESSNRNEMEMEPTFSSPFGKDELYARINDCLPPSLPPPNQSVRDCKIDCTEKSDDTPLDTVNPESEHFGKSLTVDMSSSGALSVTTADTDNDYLGPVPRQTEPSVTAVSTSVFWEPAKTEETLYDQLAGAKVRLLKRSNIQLEMVLGSGQFGTVEKGIWSKDDGSSVVVAVKKLKSETEENRIKFLREAAIMSQFEYNNVVKMYGVVLSGNPMMIVVEILPKGDLKEFLSTTRYDKAALTSDFAARLLQMSRDVAAGMTYLAGLSFIHRDLAARNVLLDKNLVCKIADFGLARDLNEKNYYIQSQKGQIPVRWTALEALSFFKYSLASDVWSYGVVLYEIWSVGERPYGYLPNKMVVENVEMGFRLPPPPGCPYAIYELMIECWNPDYHKRPAFGAISTRLSEPDDALLINEETLEPISGKIGDFLEDSCQTAYLNLQSIYRSQ